MNEADLADLVATIPATAEIPACGSIVLAVDGRTLRGTIPSEQTRGLHLVAAYLPTTGVVLAQVAV